MYQNNIVDFLQMHVNVHNGIQTASNVLSLIDSHTKSASSSIERRRGAQSTFDTFDILDLPGMEPLNEGYFCLLNQ